MKTLSLIIPIYNEEKNIQSLYDELISSLNKLPYYQYEIIFIDDGSKDNSIDVLSKLSQKDQRVKFIEFSRNFGKELAVTAGFNMASGDAAIALDADLQHPPELIPEFVQKWEAGADVVIGLRKKNTKEGFIKRYGSKTFYKLISIISDTDIIPGATDFRLIDRKVLNEFNKFSERNRLTRGLIDWLGFKRDTVVFIAPERLNGEAGYSIKKLFRLAWNSIVSHSLFPLRLAGYLGATIMCISLPLFVFMMLSKYVFANFYHFSGTALLAVLLLFLVGIILSCLGLIASYIANIHEETAGRPLYVIRSTNFKK